MQVSSMVSSGKKNYKYFIGSKDDDPKIKPLRIVLLKTSAYVKVMLGKLNGYISLSKMMSYCKDLTLFGT